MRHKKWYRTPIIKGFMNRFGHKKGENDNSDSYFARGVTWGKDGLQEVQ